MYICIHIYVCAYVYICICIYPYMYICIYIYISISRVSTLLVLDKFPPFNHSRVLITPDAQSSASRYDVCSSLWRVIMCVPVCDSVLQRIAACGSVHCSAWQTSWPITLLNQFFPANSGKNNKNPRSVTRAFWREISHFTRAFWREICHFN